MAKSSIGAYKGVDLYQGEDLQARMAEIDAASSKTSSSTKSNKTTNSSTNTGGTSVSSDVSSDSFLSALQAKLMAQSEAISSANTGIESKINEAIKGLNKGGEASNARIESSFERQKNALYEQGTSQATTANEARRGFATQTGVLKQIYADTDKSVKDLEQRKQELILQGDSERAGQIASMQLKALEFQQTSAQNVFNNLLGMSNLGLSAKAEQRQQMADQFAQKQAVGAVALQFGLDIQPGDTLDSIITRAAPLASAQQKLTLQKAQAEMSLISAQVRKLEQGMGPKSSADIDAAAKAAIMNPSILQTIEDVDTAAKVTNRMAELEGDLVVKPLVLGAIANNNSWTEIETDIKNNGAILNKNKAIADAKVLYESTAPKDAKSRYKLGDWTGSPFFDLFYAPVKGGEKSLDYSAKFVFGDLIK